MTFPRHYAWPAYLVSFALITVPFYDTLASMLPLRAGEAMWRYGAVGLIMGTGVLLPLIGLLLAFSLAILFEQPKVVRALSFLAIAGCVLCVVALLLFTLDALQTRTNVRPPMMGSFMLATAAAAGKIALLFGTLGAFAFCGLRIPASAARGSTTRNSFIVPGGAAAGGKRSSQSQSAPES